MPVSAHIAVLPLEKTESRQEKHGHGHSRCARAKSGDPGEQKGEAGGQEQAGVENERGLLQPHDRIVTGGQLQHALEVRREVQQVLARGPPEDQERPEENCGGAKRPAGLAFDQAEHDHGADHQAAKHQMSALDERNESQHHRRQPPAAGALLLRREQEADGREQDGGVKKKIIHQRNDQHHSAEPDPAQCAGPGPAEKLEQQNDESRLDQQVGDQARAKKLPGISESVEHKTEGTRHRQDVDAPLQTLRNEMRIRRVIRPVQGLVKDLARRGNKIDRQQQPRQAREEPGIAGPGTRR